MIEFQQKFESGAKSRRDLQGGKRTRERSFGFTGAMFGPCKFEIEARTVDGIERECGAELVLCFAMTVVMGEELARADAGREIERCDECERSGDFHGFDLVVGCVFQISGQRRGVAAPLRQNFLRTA